MEYEKVTTLFDSDEAEYMKEREENKKTDYIDREWLLNEGIRVTYGYNHDGIILVPMRDVNESIKKAPSADVAPRAEVAREIFEEIEKIGVARIVTFNGEILFDVTAEYDELKKKYTEDQK